MFNKLKKAFSLLLIVVSLLCIKTVVSLDILPGKYLFLLFVFMLILNILNIVLLGINKKWAYIVTIFISLIILLSSIIGIKYGKDTIDFLNKAFGNHNVEITTYDVITLKSNHYNDIDDIIGLDVGYLKSDDNSYLNKITDVNYLEYEDIYEIYSDLLNDKIKVIFIEDAYIDILKEEYSDIEDKIRVIDSFDIENEIVKVPKSTKNNNSFNIYISGSDSRSTKIYNKTRSDVNMIVSVNMDTHKVLITSIPRDYYVLVHGKTGLKDKLTHSGIYGLDISTKTLEDLFDIEIDYSIKVGFNAVVELVDLVGGVDIYSDTTFNSFHMPGWVVYKGMNHMDGKKALAYSRERYAYASGDRHRIRNQQQVLEAVLTKVLSDKKMLLKYDDLLDEFSNLYITNMPSDVITNLVKKQLDTMPKWSFESNWVDGKGAMLPTYTAPNSKRYVMIPNEEDLKTASKRINDLINE